MKKWSLKVRQSFQTRERHHIRRGFGPHRDATIGYTTPDQFKDDFYVGWFVNFAAEHIGMGLTIDLPGSKWKINQLFQVWRQGLP